MREVPIDGEDHDLDIEEGDEITFRHEGETLGGTVRKVQRRSVSVDCRGFQSMMNVPKSAVKEVRKDG